RNKISRIKKIKRKTKTKTSSRRISSSNNNSSNNNNSNRSSNSRINNHKTISSKTGISSRRRITSNNGINKISKRSSRKISSSRILINSKTNNNRRRRPAQAINPISKSSVSRVLGNRQRLVQAAVQRLRQARANVGKARRRHQGKMQALVKVRLRRPQAYPTSRARVKSRVQANRTRSNRKSRPPKPK